MTILYTVRGRGGTLEFADGTSATCDFVIRQTSDAGLRLTCDLPPLEALRQWAAEEPTAVRFVGTASDGRPLTLEGSLQMVRVHGTKATFVCSGPSPLRIGRTTTTGGRLVCLLTNCFFLGTEWIDLPDGSSYRGALPLDLSGRRVTLQCSRGASDQRRTLRETIRTLVTARAITELEKPEERQDALDAINRVTFLLSLATGAMISRVQWQLRDFGGKLIAGEIGSPPLRPYRPRTLIDSDEGEVLKRFLESTYPNYVGLDSVYQFGKAIHAKIDTTGSGFLETRTLTASALIEYLVGIYVRENGLQPPVEKQVFKKALPSLTKGVDELLSDTFGAILKGDDRQEMVDRAEWFNEPTLHRKLKFLADGLNLPTSDDELRAIRRTRNALVHRMRFHGDSNESPHKEWTRMIHFIDVTLLRLLRYTGPYVDCRTWQSAELS